MKSCKGSLTRHTLSRALTSPCKHVTFPTTGRNTVASGSNCSTSSSNRSLCCGDSRIRVYLLWSLPNAPCFLQCNRFFPSRSSALSSSTSIPISNASESVPYRKPLMTGLMIYPKQWIRELIWSDSLSTSLRYVASS